MHTAVSHTRVLSVSEETDRLPRGRAHQVARDQRLLTHHGSSTASAASLLVARLAPADCPGRKEEAQGGQEGRRGDTTRPIVICLGLARHWLNTPTTPQLAFA